MVVCESAGSYFEVWDTWNQQSVVQLALYQHRRTTDNTQKSRMMAAFLRLPTAEYKNVTNKFYDNIPMAFCASHSAIILTMNKSSWHNNSVKNDTFWRRKVVKQKTKCIRAIQHNISPWVLWHCWKSIRPVNNWVMRCWRGYVSGVRCKRFAYGPAYATATPSSLPSLKSAWFGLSGAGLPRLSWKKMPLNECQSVFQYSTT